jgi:hypothetical protein
MSAALANTSERMTSDTPTSSTLPGMLTPKAIFGPRSSLDGHSFAGSIKRRPDSQQTPFFDAGQTER